MTDSEVLQSLTDRSVLALTMWAEGRGDWREGNSSVEERIAVGCTVRNRLQSYRRWRATDPTYRSICLAPAQYSCWTPAGGKSNYDALMSLAQKIAEGTPVSDPLFKESLFLADGIMSGVILDRTGGATSYWAPAAMLPVGRTPKWAEGRQTQQIGAQKFLLV